MALKRPENNRRREHVCETKEDRGVELIRESLLDELVGKTVLMFKTIRMFNTDRNNTDSGWYSGVQ